SNKYVELYHAEIKKQRKADNVSASDCRQIPKFGVLFAVFLFYTYCINYFGSDSNDEKTID
ncbi:hypothetical protein, partial [Enterococcus faecalis]